MLIFSPQLFLPNKTLLAGKMWSCRTGSSGQVRLLLGRSCIFSEVIKCFMGYHQSLGGREESEEKEKKNKDLLIHSSLQESGFLLLQHNFLLAGSDLGPTAESSHCRLQLSCTVVSLLLCQLGLLLSFITSAINKALSSKH